MKKVFLLLVACAFTFIGAHAQNSEVETTLQLSKAEKFKTRNSIIKELEIYKHEGSGLKVYTKLFTDLKSGEQVVALEFWPSTGMKLLPNELVAVPLGYLDIDKVDDLLLALEIIVKESANSNRKDDFSITYTAPGGIDVFFGTASLTKGVVTFRKKWYTVDDYGVQTCNYSQGTATLFASGLPKLIESIKEAKIIAVNALASK